MRPWLAPSVRPFLVPLAALAVLAFSARPSLAAFAHGMECSSVGSASISSCPDESCLSISNIGSSGQDGVSIDLYRSSGHRLSSSSSWSSSTDVGALVTYQWVQVDGPSIFTHSCTLTRSGQGVMISGFEPLTTGATLYLYEGDELVQQNPLYEGGDLQITGLQALSQIPMVDLEIDSKRDLVLCSVSFPSLVTIQGSTLQFDRVVIVADWSQDGYMDVCTMRVTNPPGGSLGTVTVSSQSLTYYGTTWSCASDGFHFSEPVSSTPLLGRFNIGSSGQDGVSMTLSPLEIVLSSSNCPSGQCASWSSSYPLSLHFSSHSPLVLRPGTDQGATMRYDVRGSSSCSPDGVLASLMCAVGSTDVSISSRFSSMCADVESVLVVQDDVVVSRQAIALDGSVTVSSPPGAPQATAVTEVKYSAKAGKTGKTKLVEDIFGNLVTASDEMVLEVAFASKRLILVGGTYSSGSKIQFVGSHSGGGGGGGGVVSSTSLRVTPSTTGSGAPSVVDLQDVTIPGGDRISAISPSSGGLSSSSTVLQVPVMLYRVDPTPARGYSVTVQLSSNLVLSSAPVEWDYLSRTGDTQMYVTNEGGGRYTVDCVILGDPCGSTGSSTLFTLPVSRAPGAPDGTGTVSVEAVTLASCDNDPLPCTMGSTAYVPIDFTAPSPVLSLTATQATTGNSAGATTAIQLSYTLQDATGDPVSVEFYRAPFGSYPEYDDAGGAAPTPPSSYPPGGPWTPLDSNTLPPRQYSVCYTVNSGCTWDLQSSRDSYYYLCYTVDNAGNYSSVSSMTGGTLNYHLGDFTDGVSSCSGDNHVDASDISALGAVYGSALSLGSANACLDVGPTTNHRVSGRPMTDNKLNFEDLILSAINFHRVSAPADGPQAPLAAATNSLRLLPVTFPPVGETFDAALAMTAAGDLQGLSAQLDYDPSQLELVSVSPGELVGRQDRGGVVLSGGGGLIDAALLGEGSGLAGEGELARVRFRVRTEGEPRLALAEVEGRDVQNQPVSIALLSSPAPPVARAAIRHAYPNPFDRETRVEFTLAQRGAVRVGVYDVAGRHVRTLLDGVQDAGMLTAMWDGHDAHGVRREAGVYMIRIERGGSRETRTVRYIR